MLCHIGARAHALLARPGSGRVAAVFARSLYLQRGEDFACVGDRALPEGPLHAATREVSLSWRGLVPAGARWRSDGARVLIADRVGIELGRARLWRPPPWPAPPRARTLARRIDVLRAWLPGHQPLEGLAALALGPHDATRRLDPMLRRALPAAGAMRAWLQATDPPGPPRWVVELLGLGPGLTPSGDDLLAGAMLALHALGRRRALQDLGEAVLREAPARTSALSIAHLRAAADGQVNALLHRACAAILGSAPSRWHAPLTALRNANHCSNWDAMAGIVAVLESETHRVPVEVPGLSGRSTFNRAVRPGRRAAPR